MRRRLETLNTVDIFYDANFNRRGAFTPQSCLELSESIRDKGLLFPVVVQDDVPGHQYRLIAGHRRFIACTKLLQWATIDAMVCSGLTDFDAIIINLVENLERKNLSLWEEAQAIHDLSPGFSIRQLAKKVNKSATWVRVRLLVPDLPKEIQESIQKGVTTAQDVLNLFGKGEAEQVAAINRVKAAKARGESSHRAWGNRKVRNRKQMHQMLTNLMAEGLKPDPYNVLLWCSNELTDEELLKNVSSIY